jgi:hypothetical protein
MRTLTYGRVRTCLSPEGNASCFKRPALTLRDYGLCDAVLCLRRESLTQTGSIGFSVGLNEPSILGTQFTTCSITRRLPCMRATASQQARIFCPENLCSELPPCFAFVGSRSSRKAHERSTAGGRPEVACGPSRASLPPLPTFRKIHVDSAALTHQPFLDLRPKGQGFAPICAQLFSMEDNA